MSAESDLWGALDASTALAALVADRIYPDVVPQNAGLPCLAYLRQGTDFVSTIHSAEPVAEIVTIEIFCMAEDRDGANAVADAAVIAAAAQRFRPVDRQMLPPSDEDAVIGTVVTLERFAPL